MLTHPAAAIPISSPRNRVHGLWRSLLKGLAAYAVGRQRWYLTHEDLTAYAGRSVDAPGFEFRRARPADVPRMGPFRERMPEAVLRRWCAAVLRRVDFEARRALESAEVNPSGG